MVKHYAIFLVIILGTIFSMNAQEVSGTVLDDTSQPLPGVSIVIKGTSTGTTTETYRIYDQIHVLG